MYRFRWEMLGHFVIPGRTGCQACSLLWQQQTRTKRPLSGHCVCLSAMPRSLDATAAAPDDIFLCRQNNPMVFVLRSFGGLGALRSNQWGRLHKPMTTTTCCCPTFRTYSGRSISSTLTSSLYRSSIPRAQSSSMVSRHVGALGVYRQLRRAAHR